jgi:hypothetical protein
MAVWEAMILITWVFALLVSIPAGIIIFAIVAGRKKLSHLTQKMKLEDDGA